MLAYYNEYIFCILKKLDKLTMPYEACYEQENARPTFHYIRSFKEIKIA